MSELHKEFEEAGGMPEEAREYVRIIEDLNGPGVIWQVAKAIEDYEFIKWVTKMTEGEGASVVPTVIWSDGGPVEVDYRDTESLYLNMPDGNNVHLTKEELAGLMRGFSEQ